MHHRRDSRIVLVCYARVSQLMPHVRVARLMLAWCLLPMCLSKAFEYEPQYLFELN